MKESEWRVPCYIFGKELRKYLLLNEESLKYAKGKSQLRLDIDNINSTKTPKWTLYKLERFFSKPNSAQLERIKRCKGPNKINNEFLKDSYFSSFINEFNNLFLSQTENNK